MATIKIKAAPEEGTQQFVPYRPLPQLPYVRFPNPMSGLEKSLKQLAASYEQMSQASYASLKTDLETKFLSTIADVNHYALEEYRKAPSDGVGYTEKVGNFYTQKQAEFLESIDKLEIPDEQKKRLKQEFAQKFLRHQLQFEPKIYSQEVQLHDNKIKLDYERMIRAGQSELFTNPSALREVQQRTLESIDSLPLPAQDREKLKLDAKRRLQSAALRFESAGSSIDALWKSIVKVEGTKDYYLGNGRYARKGSTASGIGQITEGTWLGIFEKYFPDFYKSMPRERLLQLRNNPRVARVVGHLIIKEIITSLKNHGYTPTPMAVRLGWFLGTGSEFYRVLRASPDTPISALVSQKVLNANPWLYKHTAGSLRAKFKKEMEGNAGADPYPDVPADLKTQLIAAEAEKALTLARGDLQQQQLLFQESLTSFVDSLVGLSPEEQRKKIEEARKSGLFDYVKGSLLKKLEKRVVDELSDKVISNIRIAEATGKEYIIPEELMGQLNKEAQRAYAAFRKQRRKAILEEGKKLAKEGSPLFETWAENVRKNPYMQTALPEVERYRKTWEEARKKTRKTSAKSQVEAAVYLGDPNYKEKVEEAFKKGYINAKERYNLLKVGDEIQKKKDEEFEGNLERLIINLVDKGVVPRVFIDNLRKSSHIDPDAKKRIIDRWKEVEADKKKRIKETWNTLKGDFQKVVARGEHELATALAQTIVNSKDAPADFVKLAKDYLDGRFSAHVNIIKAAISNAKSPEEALGIIREALKRLDIEKKPKVYKEFKELEQKYQKEVDKRTETDFIEDARNGKISEADVEAAWQRKERWLTPEGYKQALKAAREFEKKRKKLKDEEFEHKFQLELTALSRGERTPEEVEAFVAEHFKESEGDKDKGVPYKYQVQIDAAYKVYQKRHEEEIKLKQAERLVAEGGFIDPKSEAGKLLNKKYNEEYRDKVLAGDINEAVAVVQELASKYQRLPERAVNDVQFFLLSNDLRSFTKGVELLFKAEEASPYVINQLNEEARTVWAYVSVMRQYGVDANEMFQRLQAVRETLADSRKRKALDEQLEAHLQTKGDIAEHVVELIGADGYIADQAKQFAAPLLIEHYKKLYKAFKPILGNDKDVDEAVGRIMSRMWGSWESKHNDDGWFGTKTRFMLLPPNIAYKRHGLGEGRSDFSWIDEWLDDLAKRTGYDRIVLVADKQSIDEFSSGKDVTYLAFGIKKDNIFPELLPKRVRPDLSFKERQLLEKENEIRVDNEYTGAMGDLWTPYGISDLDTANQAYEKYQMNKNRK